MGLCGSVFNEFALIITWVCVGALMNLYWCFNGFVRVCVGLVLYWHLNGREFVFYVPDCFSNGLVSILKRYCDDFQLVCVRVGYYKE